MAYILFISLYEIGYFINDRFSIKWEIQPTIRNLSYSLNPAIFIGFRSITSLTSLILLSHDIKASHLLQTSILLVGCFLMHNFIAVNLRLFTYALLRIMRYTFVPLILAGQVNAHIYTLVVMIPFMIRAIIYYTLNKMRNTDDMLKLSSRFKSFVFMTIISVPFQILFLGWASWVLLLPNLMLVSISCLSYIFFRKDF